MKLSKILAGVDVLGMTADPDMEVRDLCYDSRRTQPGDLFVAIPGIVTDGYLHIGMAVNMGAAVVLCQCAPAEEIPYVLVEDARLALALVSRNFFENPASALVLIGVTGTNGKTTSSILIKHMLESQLGVMVGLIGTNRNMIGDRALDTERTTPESYDLQRLLREMADAGCSHVVMEVSSHALALHRVSGLTFAVGIFTNLTQDHLDYHVTMDGYAEAKASLFKNCRACAVNLDDDWASTMLEAAAGTALTYSVERNEAELMAKDVKLTAVGVRFCALTTGRLERITLGIPGRFSVYNALSVIACGLLLGLDLCACKAALETAEGVKGRMELVHSAEDFSILIDYAHSPDALENVLSSLRELTSGRLVVLFGCGGDRDKAKRPLMGAIAEAYADFVIVSSDNPRTEDPAAIIEDILAGMKGKRSGRIVIENRREAIAWAIENHRPSDLLVLAGKGHEDYQIIGHEKYPMDEREIVAEALKRLPAVKSTGESGEQ